MNCALCFEPIKAGEEINWHHWPLLKSDGGKHLLPVHQPCHVRFHSRERHFKQWGKLGGKLSATTKRWAFNLKHVKDNSFYQPDRDFYTAMYSH